MAKSPQAFRTISEAAEAVGAPQHVLRFWETKFTFIDPVKRAGGRRFYRPQVVVVLKAVRRLLHDEGLTIKGVQRLYKDQGLARLAAYGDPEAAFAMDADSAPVSSSTPDGVRATVQAAPGPVSTVRLRQLLVEIEGARARLDAVLGA